MSGIAKDLERIHKCGVVTGRSTVFDRRSYSLDVGELVVARGFVLLALAKAYWACQASRSHDVNVIGVANTEDSRKSSSVGSLSRWASSHPRQARRGGHTKVCVGCPRRRSGDGRRTRT